MPNTPSAILPTMRYQDAPAASEWLCNVIGFTRHAVYPGQGNIIEHAELTLGGGMIMLGSGKDDEFGRGFKTPAELGGIETASRYVIVPDVAAVYERAVATGARIIRPLENPEYGGSTFSMKDPEGHSWSVGSYDPWAASA